MGLLALMARRFESLLKPRGFHGLGLGLFIELSKFRV